MSKQGCSLMFFQKNISEDLGLGKRLKISRTTCYITCFFTSTFIFYFSIYYYLHRPCALTICHIITPIWTSYSVFSRSHTRICWFAKRKEKKKKKTKRAKWRSTQRCVFQICYRASICWLHHRFTSIDVINIENQNIDEDRSETSEVKINSMLCFSDLLLSYVDYIINLHR